ncbi:MAG: bifunctional hydroxymethylpyrimidine kinase/phosphomethylpyrimidine kinase [Verrucomicrobiota bacterium]|nr:bifunctional hydroxymethylpyrimidine kinase/phosphomethylpyrimidine kinase [Verrucomicrobiota bacterium]
MRRVNNKKDDLYPTVLTIGGSDSGGGAGIQADLRAFYYFKVFGTSVITAVTAQNPNIVADIHPVPIKNLKSQLISVLSAFSVSHIKIGMLFSVEIIEVITEILSEYSNSVKLIVDPLMISTSGRPLLEKNAVQILKNLLIPMADIITPNLPEAHILAEINPEEDISSEKLAEILTKKYDTAVLLTGGHSKEQIEKVIDILCFEDSLYSISNPRIKNCRTTHGTGCSVSAALTACLANGMSPYEAAEKAVQYVRMSLKNTIKIGENAHALWPCKPKK